MFKGRSLSISHVKCYNSIPVKSMLRRTLVLTGSDIELKQLLQFPALPSPFPRHNGKYNTAHSANKKFKYLKVDFF